MKVLGIEMTEEQYLKLNEYLQKFDIIYFNALSKEEKIKLINKYIQETKDENV